MGKENKKEEYSESRKESIDMDILSKIFAPAKILFRMHMRLLSKELKKDLGRYISGMIVLFLGVVFIIVGALLLNAVAVAALDKFSELDLFYSVLIITGGNFLVAILMFLSAGANFKKPFLKETRKVFKETLDDMKGKK